MSLAHFTKDTLRKPLVKVMATLCSDVSAALIIGGVLSWKTPTSLLLLCTCGTFTLFIAFVLEWMIDHSPLESWN